LNLQHNLQLRRHLPSLKDSYCCCPLRRSHVVYDGSHGSNLKLLKIDILTDASITKVREVTKTRNFLGTLFGFVTVSL
jgi:hypothetical protein